MNFWLVKQTLQAQIVKKDNNDKKKWKKGKDNFKGGTCQTSKEITRLTIKLNLKGEEVWETIKERRKILIT